MALFQSSVLKKYLAAQEHRPIHEAFAAYLTYFHNPRIRDNIRAAKEEQFQEGFLRELFVKIFGYTINPEPDFNLTTELKNIKDSKKTDGAILKDGNALAVIELKGTDTKDLDKIRDQAFNYKNNQPECVYVITSNFEKLRFYIDNAVDYVEFNILAMESDQFKLMWLLLQKDNLLSGLPKKIKEESLLAEEQITKQLYRDYSAFKQELWQDLVAQNPGQDELLLYKKSQKLLDRFLFIFFAEDKGLLPPNSIMEIVNQWVKLKELDEYRPIYERFKKYFGYLNTGRVIPGKPEIHAYNGGLFAPDPILDTLTISDSVLEKHVRKLTEYDFDTEVDTNILGHIFEHSLNDIENVRAMLAGQEVDKSKTKRKRDGVFYTPKYITKYIVDNTLGRLCTEKKAELQLVDEEFSKYLHYKTKEAERKRKTELKHKLDTYRNWLLQLTICDPACGSGAFLNQVLEFLIAEHRYVDELEAQLFDTPLVLPNVENHILENNIFGVDINEESVEIARLSLWLRTAKKGRKLSSLNSNIKVGNSLIDDPAVAGDLAFDWQAQFPQVFAKGGFDVVVGNPPYVRVQGLKEHYFSSTVYYENKYESATGNYDIYALFLERSYYWINQKGLVSFILPHKFLVSDFGIGIRKFFKRNQPVKNILHFGSEMVFEDASTYTCIITLNKIKNEVIHFKKINPIEIHNEIIWDNILYQNLSEENWDLQSNQIFDLIEKLKQQPYRINDVFSKIFVGLQTSLDAIYVFEGVDSGNYIKGFNPKYDFYFEIEKELIKPFIKGNEISKYKALENSHYLLFPYREDGSGVSESYIKENLPKTYSYLKKFEKEIRGRENGKMDISEGWYLYIYQKNHEKFPHPKIMTQEISFGCNMTYDSDGIFYHPTTIYSFIKNNEFEVDEKFYLGILNSKVMWFFLKNTGTELRGGYFRFKTNYLKPFPLPDIPNNSQHMIDLVNNILNLQKESQKIRGSFISFFKSKFPIFNPSTKLQNWPDLDFKGFLGELSKAKVKLSLSEEAEWMTYFNEQKAKALALQADITRLDREIDALVYELYGLTEEEVKIVEGN